jgi:hypothetical protein
MRWRPFIVTSGVMMVLFVAYGNNGKVQRWHDDLGGEGQHRLLRGPLHRLLLACGHIAASN